LAQANQQNEADRAEHTSKMPRTSPTTSVLSGTSVMPLPVFGFRIGSGKIRANAVHLARASSK